MDIHLRGKTILVTGGTGTLGRAIVEKAVTEGAGVYFTFHQNQDLAKELIRKGARGFRLDLRDRSALDLLRDELRKEIASLDGLVLNAAAVRDRTLINLSEPEFDEVLETDLTSGFLLVKKFLPLLYKSPAGKIVGITSRVGTQGGFGEANYAAAKAGLSALIKTLAQEVGRKGICANAVAPGFMMSPMTADLPDEVYARQRAESVLGCFQDPGEVSDFVIYLLSDSVKKVSGQIFYFDSRRTKIF
ncbi:MAG TPA: SDR family oxidoreductase [Candidatus Omnitrophota bacterium]|nr:SDR family oxidoreductase [Candidatus Omnitrophota bacterium]